MPSGYALLDLISLREDLNIWNSGVLSKKQCLLNFQFLLQQPNRNANTILHPQTVPFPPFVPFAFLKCSYFIFGSTQIQHNFPWIDIGIVCCAVLIMAITSFVSPDRKGVQQRKPSKSHQLLRVIFTLLPTSRVDSLF